MRVTSARKAAGMALTAVAILALATSTAFAGKGVGGDNGNKYGNDNKKATEVCTDDYYVVYQQWGDPADLNDNGAICEKYSGLEGGYSRIDDISGKPGQF
jgi:hypothetical protein